MMFWGRLRQSRHKFYAFANEFKRFYYLNHGPIVANQHISSRTLVPILKNPKFIVQDSQLEFLRKVRFYAKRVKSTPKKVKEDPREPRMNEQITAPRIRLVTDEGHNEISIHQAMAFAKSLELDLVEVDRQAMPPVCKIYDYNKQKYLQQTKEKERAKSKTQLKKGPPKEVRFAAKIKQNDLKIKADMAKRLMESGHRVKCTAMDPTDDVDLKTLLSRFSALIEDVAIEETTPKYEKTQAFIVVRHVKFGPSKKGSGNKASGAVVSSTMEETGETIEVGLESEHLDEDVQKNKSEWAGFDGGDDGHSIFDINNEENGQYSSKSSKHKQSADLRHVGETGPTNTASSIPFGSPKPAMENRYARDPRSAKPPRIPTEVNHRDARNTINSVPGIPNQGNQSRVGMNTSPQMRPKQVEVPCYEVSKQDSSHSSNPNSPPKSYGIFSSQQVNTTPHEQNATAATNRYKINNPADSARTTGPSPQRGSPSADSRMNRGPGVDNPSEGRWGIFSSDNSNKNGNQAEIQRR